MTLTFARPFYLIASLLMHFAYYHWFKSTFAPDRERLRYERETFWFDIKWSMLNIIGQTPLVSLIKMGYPYYSKVQYEFVVAPSTIFYLLFHVCYD